MNFLSNANWQFAVSTILSIISLVIGLLGIWIAFKRPVLAIAYETIDAGLVDDSEDEAKDVIEEKQFSSDADLLVHPYFIVFKIWNAGREPIVDLNETRPLIIIFKNGLKILNCQIIDKGPDYVEATHEVHEEMVLLLLPVLNPKKWITLRIIVTDPINYFPGIFFNLPGDQKIIKANNVRKSKQLKIGAIVYLCAAICAYIFFFSGLFLPGLSFKHDPLTSIYFLLITVLFLLVGITFLIESLLIRHYAPYPN